MTTEYQQRRRNRPSYGSIVRMGAIAGVLRVHPRLGNQQLSVLLGIPLHAVDRLAPRVRADLRIKPPMGPKRGSNVNSFLDIERGSDIGIEMRVHELARLIEAYETVTRPGQELMDLEKRERLIKRLLTEPIERIMAERA
jgi:hypothetical protein